jgi:hypothetical protein
VSTHDKFPLGSIAPAGAETIYLNVQEPSGPPISALLYYAVLAYPGRDEWQKRRSFLEAMAAMRFKEFAIQKGNRKGIPREFSGFKKEKMLGGISLGWKRVDRRIHAGIMGWCICLNEKFHPYEAPTPDGKEGVVFRGPNTVNKVVRAYVEGRQHSSDGVHLALEPALANVAHRIWAESFPVLHIAMSNPFTIKIVETQVNTGPPTAKQIAKDFFNSIHETGWLRKALEDAEQLKLDLRERLGIDPGDPRSLGFYPERAISLLPTEDLSLAYRFPK